MNIQYLAWWLKKRQGCGWILAMFGGLFVCFGIFITVSFIGDVASTVTVKELLSNILGLTLYVPMLPIGILLLVIGIWLINRKENTHANEEEGKRNSHRIWGWISALVGGMLTLFGIFMLYVSLFVQDSVMKIGGIMVYVLPELIIGVLLLFIGIRKIKSRI